MYKYAILIVGMLIAASLAHDDDAHAKAHETKKQDAHGNFAYSFDVTNGIGAKEEGDEHNHVHGEYHFMSKEGIPIAITYTADENGYQAHGDAVPTPPPIPAAILESLAYIKSHPPHKEEPKSHPASSHGHGKH
ncbi:pupal cuticle protein Edg-78E [Drosophila grimshawi]|uniref:GH21572 n=1 Tax=Drosophila grimshawi TaxID=7222 RepID=B4J4W6_DROGR|nr:pupal cuticle protein Edg-78E [Drosophila grimshawi]EDW01672.1 GH21572 [Drosophila grimshawi]